MAETLRLWELNRRGHHRQYTGDWDIFKVALLNETIGGGPWYNVLNPQAMVIVYGAEFGGWKEVWVALNPDVYPDNNFCTYTLVNPMLDRIAPWQQDLSRAWRKDLTRS